MSLPKGGILIACLNIIQIGFYNRSIIGETIIERLSIGFFVELDVESLRSLKTLPLSPPYRAGSDMS